MAVIRVTELNDTDKVVIRNLVNHPVVIVTRSVLTFHPTGKWK